MDNLEQVLSDRLDLLNGIRLAFRDLHPEEPDRLHRGEIQTELLTYLNAPLTGFNRRAVTEALSILGYRKVKTRGFLFYRRKGDLKCV